jgi:hypothetical protein
MASKLESAGSFERDDDIGPTDGLNHDARAFQMELRDDMLETLERFVARRKLARLDLARDQAGGRDASVLIAWTSSRETRP